MSVDPSYIDPTSVVVIQTGPGPARGIATGEVQPTDPQAQYIVSGGRWSARADGGLVLSQAIDDAMVRYGPRIYDWMVLDDQVASSFATVKLGILGDGLEVSPRVAAEPGAEVTDPAERADIDLAREIADFLRRCMDRLRPTINQTLMEFLDALGYGAVLGEKTYEVAQGGPDKGRMVLKTLRVKSRDSWAFVVDAYYEILGIYAWTVGGPMVLDREKFAVYTWGARGGDPRGTSILRPAYNPWNLKVQQDPERAKYTAQFADPSVVIYYDSEITSPVYARNADGSEDTSRLLQPHQQAEAAAQSFHGGSYLTLPNTWKAELLASTGDGSAFRNNEDSYNRAIARAILLAARTTNEAQHGSKADTQASADITEMLFGFGRGTFADFIEREIFHGLVALNWGKEVADRLNGKAGFRMPKQVVASLWTAFANLFRVGAVPKQLLPRIFVELLGLPWAADIDLDDLGCAGHAAADDQGDDSGDGDPPDESKDEESSSSDPQSESSQK